VVAVCIAMSESVQKLRPRESGDKETAEGMPSVDLSLTAATADRA